ncbi:hypothetical protein [uncultured Thiodictyon sp.]|jgi:hypothetical protein|uniref:hypothetical protein n=1 Tax=uncultured Thiodictyon sp. TaxID=1846217 RepID=UPI0025DE368C|nr:hypothetical protein [uncultured Thiodictyon sp.]
MQDTLSTPRKQRGRPASGRARTGAQRSAALRERAKTLVFEGHGALGDQPASVLLEGIGAAYRAKMPFDVERIATELLRRLGHGIPVSVTEASVTGAKTGGTTPDRSNLNRTLGRGAKDAD